MRPKITKTTFHSRKLQPLYWGIADKEPIGYEVKDDAHVEIHLKIYPPFNIPADEDPHTYLAKRIHEAFPETEADRNYKPPRFFEVDTDRKTIFKTQVQEQ